MGLTSALGGRAVTFLLGGEAGVGKTRLVEELGSRAADRGAAVLAGGCLDVEEGRLPFGPFAEALRGHVRTLGADAQAALGGGELAVMVPERGPGNRDAAPTRALVQGQLFELVLGTARAACHRDAIGSGCRRPALVGSVHP